MTRPAGRYPVLTTLGAQAAPDQGTEMLTAWRGNGSFTLFLVSQVNLMGTPHIKAEANVGFGGGPGYAAGKSGLALAAGWKTWSLGLTVAPTSIGVSFSPTCRHDSAVLTADTATRDTAEVTTTSKAGSRGSESAHSARGRFLLMECPWAKMSVGWRGHSVPPHL